MSAERRRRHIGAVETRNWRHETQTGYTLDQPLSCPENQDHFTRPCKASVRTGFSGYLLRSAPMRRQIERIAQGISVLGISKCNLEKLTFFLPHPVEQRKIADFLSALDVKIDLVGQELTHAHNFKQGLLQQMFV